jgi:hypothetical protein
METNKVQTLDNYFKEHNSIDFGTILLVNTKGLVQYYLLCQPEFERVQLIHVCTGEPISYDAKHLNSADLITKTVAQKIFKEHYDRTLVIVGKVDMRAPVDKILNEYKASSNEDKKTKEKVDTQTHKNKPKHRTAKKSSG